MVKLCLFAFVMLILFCFMNSVRSASNQYLGAKNCTNEANWAVSLMKDRDAGIPVNVMPKDQHVLELVRLHKGTREELWHKVFHDCSDTRT